MCKKGTSYLGKNKFQKSSKKVDKEVLKKGSKDVLQCVCRNVARR